MLPVRKGSARRRPVAIIGWNEYVDLPEWGIHGLRAKIDTGARTSALHVANLEELPDGRVRFDVVTDRNGPAIHKRITAELTRRARVRSSTGFRKRRVFVTTTVTVGGMERRVEMSLVDREKMVYRMLIGRSALGGRFLVDTGGQCLHGRPGPARGRSKERA